MVPFTTHPDAGAADDAAHKIYIWDLAREGLLASTLDGGRELLTDVHVRLGYSLRLLISLTWCEAVASK